MFIDRSGVRPIFESLCHPKAEEVCKDVDHLFSDNWDFENEKTKSKFCAAGFSRVACLYFPKALDSRIGHICSLLTALFLIDGETFSSLGDHRSERHTDRLEDMTLEDGRNYNNRLMALCRGDDLPNRNSPVEWILYDLWQSMQSCDRRKADDILEPLETFMIAQTAKERLSIADIGHYLKYRRDDVGQEFLAAVMRFSMDISLSCVDLESTKQIEINCGRHIAVVNDIYSYEKEKRANMESQKEGSMLCNAVQVIALQFGIDEASAITALWAMCRGWEHTHKTLVEARLGNISSCSSPLREYVKGLEYQMSGNELWSSQTARYSSA